MKLFLCFLLLVSCTKKVNLNFTVEVKNSDSKVVRDAVVRVNGVEVGRSGADGILATQLTLKPKTKVKIEVSKQSDEFYYAPFYSSFVTGEIDLQEKKIAAVLYFVPKPKKENSDSDKLSESNPNEVVKNDKTKKEEEKNQEKKEEKKPEEVVAKEKAESFELSKPVRDDVIPTRSHKAKTSQAIFTVHVRSANQPVSKSVVYFGVPGKGNFKRGCTTNTKGRCVIRFDEVPKDTLTLIARKAGYQTKSMKTRVSHRGKLNFQVARGNAIDVFAVSKTYNYVRGVAGIDVFVKGKKVGSTNQFGHFSYFYSGKKSDLVDIKLSGNQGQLPEDYEADFVVSGPLSLVRYFTPRSAPIVKTAILSLKLAGQNRTTLGGENWDVIESAVENSARKHLFKGAFGSLNRKSYREHLKSTRLSSAQILAKGWDKTDLKADLDVVVQPTLVLSSPPVLELSAIDSRARVLSAAKETLSNFKDIAAVDQAVNSISKKLRRSFPFEGSVLGKDGDQITVNLGFGSGRGIQKGDLLDVYGSQVAKFGNKQDHVKIGSLKIEEVWEELARAKLTKLAPRSAVTRGDLVKLRPSSSLKISQNKKRQTSIRVLSQVGAAADSPVAQANVYLNGDWVGSTDLAGRMFVPKKFIGKSGQLKVIKHGYREFSREMRLAGGSSLKVPLAKAMAFLRVDSEPSESSVYVEGKLVGKTPLTSPVAVNSGFVKLEIRGPKGFKTYKSILDLDEGTIELVEKDKIVLERDFQPAVTELVAGGKYRSALKRLASVPKKHSDYLYAQHQIGEIWLTKLKDPVRAADAFAEVTKVKAVANFNDKRFIASHINEGLALFLSGEKLEDSDPALASEHYLKAAGVFKSVLPQLRFVPPGDYNRAWHNVSYHRALALHRVWNRTKDPSILNSAFKEWRTYLQSSKAKESKFLESAKVYFKQAQVSLDKDAG